MPQPNHDPMTAAVLAAAEIRVQLLIKALAQLGCTCHVKTRDVELDSHERFCKYRMKAEDLECFK